MPIIGKFKSKNKDDFKMPEWMECSWRRVPCNKDKCPICGRVKKDRQRHIDKGEDPDDLKSVFEDVGNNLHEALAMVKKDAERMGIDITNIDDIKEPPEPEKFPFYRKVEKWRNQIIRIADDADNQSEFWLHTELASDLLWYTNTLCAKTYRQLCNKWHIKHGDGYGDFDYDYTKYVLGECLKILKKSLNDLSLLNSGNKGELISLLSGLFKLEKRILTI